MSYDFKGNNAALVSSIHALLALDAKGALAPYGIGEMARQLLEASASRLIEKHQGEQISGAVILAGKRHDSIDTETLSIELLTQAYLRAGEREHEQRTELATWKRRANEAESKLRTYDPQVVELGERAMQALLADPEPSELVLTKCKLCDQLQADLTARDQRIDFLEQQIQLADHWLESASFNSVGEPIEHTQDMRDDFRKQMIAAVFPDYVEASTHGRLNGVPASPCVGCGAPGYTGNCNKCVPY